MPTAPCGGSPSITRHRFVRRLSRIPSITSLPITTLPSVSRATIHGRNMSVNFFGLLFRFSFMIFVLSLTFTCRDCLQAGWVRSTAAPASAYRTSRVHRGSAETSTSVCAVSARRWINWIILQRWCSGNASNRLCVRVGVSFVIT